MKRFILFFFFFKLVNVLAQNQSYESASFSLTPDSSNNNVLIFREKIKPANYSNDLNQPGWTVENWFSTSNYFGMTSDYPKTMYGKEISKLEKNYKIKLINANYYIPDLEKKISPKSFVFLKEDVESTFKANNIYECLYFVNAFPKSKRKMEFVEQYILGAQKHHINFMLDFLYNQGKRSRYQVDDSEVKITEFKKETIQHLIAVYGELCSITNVIPYTIRKDSTYYQDFAKIVKSYDDFTNLSISILDIYNEKFSASRKKALIAALDNMILKNQSTVATSSPCSISLNEGKSEIELLTYLNQDREKLIAKGYGDSITDTKLFEYIGVKFKSAQSVRDLINKLEVADAKAYDKTDEGIVTIDAPHFTFWRPLNSTYSFFYNSIFAISTNPDDLIAIATNKYLANIYHVESAGYFLGTKNELNKFNGKGLLYTSKNGNYLFGNWQNGVLTGFGISKNNNIVKKGEFKDSRLQNGKVEIQYPNGSIYNGDFVNGSIEGVGSFNLADGSIYTGSFVNNEFSGNGKLTYPDGSWYDGAWKYGNREGIGTYRTKDGFRFTGKYVNNKPHGKFKVEKWLLSGLVSDVYEVTFNMGKPEGDVSTIKSDLTDFLTNKPTPSSYSNNLPTTSKIVNENSNGTKIIQKVTFEITRKNVCAYDCIESYELNIIEDSKKLEKITIAKRKDGQWLTYCPTSVSGTGEIKNGGTLLEAAKYYYTKQLKKTANSYIVTE